MPLDVAPHGPEYMRVLIDLLARYDGRSRREMRRLAVEHGVKVARR